MVPLKQQNNTKSIKGKVSATYQFGKIKLIIVGE